MSAFVPAPGLTLSASRPFVSGTALRSGPRSDDRPVHPRPHLTTTTMISLDFISKALKKKGSPPAAAPRKPAAPPKTKASGVVAVPRNARIASDRPAAAPVRKTPSNKPGSDGPALAGGIPKFYNPTTSRAEFRATAKGQNATPLDIRLNPAPVTTNERVNANGTFRNMNPYTADLVWARQNWSSDEARVGVRAALKHVLGNANLFESEVEELATSISCVTGTANMKEFVRAVGLSNAYRKRFFDSSSNTRFVECNFINFLGRAPHNQAEVSEHIQVLIEHGYNAEINSYVDSDEYDALFGESRVPATNFRGGHPYNNDMNKIALLRGPSSSSRRVTTSAIFPTGDTSGFSPYSITRSLPDAWRGENRAREQAGPVLSFDPNVFWNPQPIGLIEAEVAWKSRMGSWSKFWYKDSQIYKEMMKPQLKHSDQEMEEAAAALKYGTNMSKMYVGARKVFDAAPVIEVTPPAAGQKYGGRVSLKLEEISFAIPSELSQTA